MNKFEFAVPMLFGLEGICGDELRRLDIENVRVENGRVLFSGDENAIARVNLCLRTGERVLLVLGSFHAEDFDALFEGTKALPWERFIPRDGQFPVKGHCLNSQLMSVSDCQAIIKKAASRRLGEKYGVSWLPETGIKFQLHFTILNDQVTLSLDTSGQGLHKRGYRAIGNDAPLHETLAAGMIQLTRYRGREFFWDPFCGSGTIAIEAAMILANKAPGLGRAFSAEAFLQIPACLWTEAREAAEAAIKRDSDFEVYASDIDEDILDTVYENALRAGVEEHMNIFCADVRKMQKIEGRRGTVVCNPPYGERMMEQQSAQRLYAALGRHLKFANDWKKFVITSEPEFEHYFGRRADKKRKFYNGKIKCDYYMFTDNSRRKK
mgnify:CR=1 FL=1